MCWESDDVFRFDLGAPPLRSNDGSLALVSCLFGGYKFALVFRCVGLVRTCKNPWPLNLLQVTNLTFGPCFKWGRHTKIAICVVYWPLALDLSS